MPPAMASKVVHLTIGGKPVELNISATTAPVPARAMLPLFRSLSDAFTALSEQLAQSRGQAVSCRKGCAACCRQLVPLTEVEALEMAQLVSRMAEPQRSEVLHRFAVARERLAQAGLLESLANLDQVSPADQAQIGLAYFKLTIDCPFLEAEMCTIHSDRPLACREFQVVSPPEYCSRPQEMKAVRTELLADVSGAVRSMKMSPASRPNRWIPLPLALEWTAARLNEETIRPGTEWADELMKTLEKQAISPKS